MANEKIKFVKYYIGSVQYATPLVKGQYITYCPLLKGLALLTGIICDGAALLVAGLEPDLV